MVHQLQTLKIAKQNTVNILKFWTILSFCSQAKFFFMTETHKIPVRKANREDPVQTASWVWLGFCGRQPLFEIERLHSQKLCKITLPWSTMLETPNWLRVTYTFKLILQWIIFNLFNLQALKNWNYGSILVYLCISFVKIILVYSTH